MRMAIKEAQKGIDCGHGGPFGSVIVKNDVVIAKAHNEVIKQGDPTCHGEMLAIRKACKKIGTYDLSGCEIYTTGEPCPMCLGAILWANINKVYYGCNVNDTEEIGFRDKAFYTDANEAMKQNIVELDRQQCLLLYKRYNDINGKLKY